MRQEVHPDLKPPRLIVPWPVSRSVKQAAADLKVNRCSDAIAMGKGTVFCIDGYTQPQINALARRGLKSSGPARIRALDAKTGKELWTASDAFGTWLAYSSEHDLVLEGGSSFSDRASDEAKQGMAVYNAASGKLVWKKDIIYQGPPILYHGMILTQTGGQTLEASPAYSYSLLTGEPATRLHPLDRKSVV